MKQLLFILICFILTAQDIIATENTTIFFDNALLWIDTTDCQSDTLITELPDSLYKQRLQAC